MSGCRTVVIGAASDIGGAVHHACPDGGPRRRQRRGEARLDSLANSGVELLPANLTSGEQLDRLWATPADILVSVGGLAHVERFTDSDPSLWGSMWEINLLAPMLLPHRLVPAMVANGRGRLVYISSNSARAGAGGEARAPSCWQEP